jgi:Rrf2 family protein
MSKIVQLSEAVSIAIHSMVLIAKAEGKINVNKIAEETGASKNHLAKVMQRLVKQGLLSSNRGPAGGFILKKAASKITLLEIYECIEGPIESDKCPQNKDVCHFSKCLMGGILKKVTNEFIEHFKSHTIQDFING